MRPAHSPTSFYPYEHTLGTMLHELVHMAISPHNAKFYAVRAGDAASNVPVSSYAHDLRQPAWRLLCVWHVVVDRCWTSCAQKWKASLCQVGAEVRARGEQFRLTTHHRPSGSGQQAVAFPGQGKVRCGLPQRALHGHIER